MIEMATYDDGLWAAADHYAQTEVEQGRSSDGDRTMQCYIANYCDGLSRSTLKQILEIRSARAQQLSDGNGEA